MMYHVTLHRRFDWLELRSVVGSHIRSKQTFAKLDREEVVWRLQLKRCLLIVVKEKAARGTFQSDDNYYFWLETLITTVNSSILDRPSVDVCLFPRDIEKLQRLELLLPVKVNHAILYTNTSLGCKSWWINSWTYLPQLFPATVVSFRKSITGQENDCSSGV